MACVNNYQVDQLTTAFWWVLCMEIAIGGALTTYHTACMSYLYTHEAHVATAQCSVQYPTGSELGDGVCIVSLPSSPY